MLKQKFCAPPQYSLFAIVCCALMTVAKLSYNWGNAKA